MNQLAFPHHFDIPLKFFNEVEGARLFPKELANNQQLQLLKIGEIFILGEKTGEGKQKAEPK